MKKLTLGLFFGGRSTEHEVSVITALQAFENLDKSKYEIVPVYVDKTGQMYTNPKFLELKNYKDVKKLTLSSRKVTLVKGGLQTLGSFSINIPLDVAFPLIHGSFGEDGSLQGTFEFNQIPYIGFGILGSAVGMDKLSSKLFFQSFGLPIGRYIYIGRDEWLSNPQECLKRVHGLKKPWIVKPGTIGSSIGVNRAEDMDRLSFYIDVASTYSEKIIVEECFTDTVEVNCSALGYLDPKPSVCEMPVSGQNLLSFKDKYQRGGSKNGSKSGMASLQRIIPAPISNNLTKEIQETTVKIFKALDGCGVARVDYFVNQKTGKFWVNEINTIPGSLSFYLWKPKGIDYKKMLDMLVNFALERAQNQRKTQYTFESGLLSQMAGTGGVKR